MSLALFSGFNSDSTAYSADYGNYATTDVTADSSGYDGLPFSGSPKGELLGYAYLALPLTDARYPPAQAGKLAAFDRKLFVNPPKGMEVGFVPIVVRQELTAH